MNKMIKRITNIQNMSKVLEDDMKKNNTEEILHDIELIEFFLNCIKEEIEKN